MQINILAVADAVSPVLYDHFRPERWAGVDLVLSCGDLPPYYLDFLCSSLNVPVLYVRGNHDDKYPDDAYDGCINVHGTIVEAAGVRVAGFEGSHCYNGRERQYTQRQMERIGLRSRIDARMHGKPDIVLAHAPPQGCHDGQDVCHQGFRAFRRLIDVWRPLVFVHGHMHAYEGQERMTTIGDTAVVNAFPYTVLRLEARERTVESYASPAISLPAARTRSASSGLRASV